VEDGRLAHRHCGTSREEVRSRRCFPFDCTAVSSFLRFATKPEVIVLRYYGVFLELSGALMSSPNFFLGIIGY